MATPPAALPPTTAAHGAARGAAGASVSGRQVVRVRVAWGVVAGLLVALYVLLLPAYWAQLDTVCGGARCALAQPSPASAVALYSLGLSVAGYARLTLAVTLTSSLICFAVAGVIIWRKSDDRMALVVALAVVALGTALAPNQLETARTPWQLLALVVDVINFAVLFLAFALFPSGGFVPRWTRWLVSGWVVAGAAVVGVLLVSGPLWITAYEAVWSVATAGLVVAQVYRYRVVSDAHARAQTRWVVFSGSAALVIALALTAPALLVPSLGQRGSLFELLGPPIGALAIAAVALSIGIAILRYHLYDIDVIIERTVVYTILFTVLAVVYEGGVVVLEKGLLSSTRQSGLVAEAAFAFVVGTLAQPLHRRIDQGLARVFYRRKYVADRQIEALSKQLRHQWRVESRPEAWEEAAEQRIERALDAMRHQPANQSAYVQPPLFP